MLYDRLMYVIDECYVCLLKHEACSRNLIRIIRSSKTRHDEKKDGEQSPVLCRPALGRVGLWFELEMVWPPQPLHSRAPGTYTQVRGPYVR